MKYQVTLIDPSPADKKAIELYSGVLKLPTDTPLRSLVLALAEEIKEGNGDDGCTARVMASMLYAWCQTRP